MHVTVKLSGHVQCSYQLNWQHPCFINSPTISSHSARARQSCSAHVTEQPPCVGWPARRRPTASCDLLTYAEPRWPHDGQQKTFILTLGAKTPLFDILLRGMEPEVREFPRPSMAQANRAHHGHGVLSCHAQCVAATDKHTGISCMVLLSHHCAYVGGRMGVRRNARSSRRRTAIQENLARVLCCSVRVQPRPCAKSAPATTKNGLQTPATMLGKLIRTIERKAHGLSSHPVRLVFYDIQVNGIAEGTPRVRVGWITGSHRETWCSSPLLCISVYALLRPPRLGRTWL